MLITIEKKYGALNLESMYRSLHERINEKEPKSPETINL